MRPDNSIGLRFSLANFERMQAEAAATGFSLRTVLYGRMRALLDAWPNVAYEITEDRHKKRIFMDLTAYPMLPGIARSAGYGIAQLGDMLATFEAKE